MNDNKILNDAKCSVFKYFDSGDWVVRGSETGQIVLFKILDDEGLLVKSWDGHFNAVSALAVPINENGFYSAGNDGCICYYSLSNLKMISWNAHSAPIIGFHLSRGISLENSHVWSLSLDKKCKVISCNNTKMWSSKGKLIKDWNILDIPSTFSINSLETWMFIATNTGIILGVSTKSDQTLIDTKSAGLVYNSNDSVPISQISLSLDEQYLFSGNKSGVFKVWDISNQTCLNSVSFECNPSSINIIAEIIGILSTINPLMDPDSIPKVNLKKLNKYPMSQELYGKVYVDSISVGGEVVKEVRENIDMDESLLRLKQENADLKILNANLFKSAINALSQKSLA